MKILTHSVSNFTERWPIVDCLLQNLWSLFGRVHLQWNRRSWHVLPNLQQQNLLKRLKNPSNDLFSHLKHSHYLINTLKTILFWLKYFDNNRTPLTAINRSIKRDGRYMRCFVYVIFSTKTTQQGRKLQI